LLTPSHRLLRNRLSAQQARERKKAYQQSIEERLESHQATLQAAQDAVRRLTCENQTLRKLLQTAVSLPALRRGVPT